jgi:hypothetical protein
MVGEVHLIFESNDTGLPTLSFLKALSFLGPSHTRPSPAERLYRPHRLALGHMALNILRKSAIFLVRITKYSVRNRPYKALEKGLARKLIPSIPPNLERT